MGSGWAAPALSAASYPESCIENFHMLPHLHYCTTTGAIQSVLRVQDIIFKTWTFQYGDAEMFRQIK